MSMEELERAINALEQTQYLLERMLSLAEYSASGKCDDAQRQKLQKAFELLRELQDYNVDRYERGQTNE